MVATQEFKFPSSSSPKIYTTRINSDGLLSCDCPGWTVKKLNKSRECKHTKSVGAKLKLTERDGNWYVSDGTKVASAVTAKPSLNVVEAVAKAGPGFIEPMLASAMPAGKDADSFAADAFVMEEKFDGIRLIVRVDDAVHAWSRLGNSRQLAPALHDLMARMPEGVYDGELIQTSSQRSTGQDVLVLFDCLEIKGQSIMKLACSRRREFLEVAIQALGDAPDLPVRLTEQFSPSMAKVREIWARHGEGAIIKDRAATYQPGWRTPYWIKVKERANATLTIIGFTAGKNGPYSTIDIRDDSGIETSVKTLDNELMRQIAANPKSFIGRRVVIHYQERMESGKYRHPGFDHFAGIGE